MESSVLTTIVLNGGGNLEKLLLTLENFNQRPNKQTRLDTESHNFRKQPPALNCSLIPSFKGDLFSQVLHKCKLLFHLLLQNVCLCRETASALPHYACEMLPVPLANVVK